MNEAIRMQVSAFVDGELPENEAELLVRRLSQDAQLRRQVAEYLEIGRVMRGEYNVQGSDVLRERISAELDQRPLQDAADETPGESSSRYVRPLAGFAIAATVALVAIVGLQQTAGVDVAVPEDELVSESVSETVPTISSEDEQYYLLHIETSNTFDARWTAAQIRAEELAEEIVDDSESADDETGESETSEP